MRPSAPDAGRTGAARRKCRDATASMMLCSKDAWKAPLEGGGPFRSVVGPTHAARNGAMTLVAGSCKEKQQGLFPLPCKSRTVAFFN